MLTAREYAIELVKKDKCSVCWLSRKELRALSGMLLSESEEETKAEAIYEGHSFEKLPALLSEFMIGDSASVKEEIIEILIDGAVGYFEDAVDEVLFKARNEFQIEL